MMKTTFRLEVEAHDLPKMDWFGKSDPYFVIETIAEPPRGKPGGALRVKMGECIQNGAGNGINLIGAAVIGTALLVTHPFHTHGTTPGFRQVYVSQVIKKTLNCKWPAFFLKAEDLCGGDKHRDVMFSVYDWDRFKSSELIGSVTTTLKMLLDLHGESLTLWKGSKKRGRITVTCCAYNDKETSVRTETATRSENVRNDVDKTQIEKVHTEVATHTEKVYEDKARTETIRVEEVHTEKTDTEKTKDKENGNKVIKEVIKQELIEEEVIKEEATKQEATKQEVNTEKTNTEKTNTEKTNYDGANTCTEKPACNAQGSLYEKQPVPNDASLSVQTPYQYSTTPPYCNQAQSCGQASYNQHKSFRERVLYDEQASYTGAPYNSSNNVAPNYNERASFSGAPYKEHALYREQSPFSGLPPSPYHSLPSYNSQQQQPPPPYNSQSPYSSQPLAYNNQSPYNTHQSPYNTQQAAAYTGQASIYVPTYNDHPCNSQPPYNGHASIYVPPGYDSVPYGYQ